MSVGREGAFRPTSDSDRVGGSVPAPYTRNAGERDDRRGADPSALDAVRCPAVALAREAGELGGTAPAVLNAANEEAVALFLKGERRFVEIVPAVRRTVEHARPDQELTLDAVIAADRWARAQVRAATGGSSRVRSKLPA